jgi:hypothetical protein
MYAILHAFVLWHKDWANGRVRLAGSKFYEVMPRGSIRNNVLFRRNPERDKFTTYPADPSQSLFRTSTGPFTQDFIIDRVRTLLLQIGVNATASQAISFPRVLQSRPKKMESHGITLLSRQIFKEAYRNKAHEASMNLSNLEEKKLIHWIEILTQRGYVPQYR